MPWYTSEIRGPTPKLVPVSLQNEVLQSAVSAPRPKPGLDPPPWGPSVSQGDEKGDLGPVFAGVSRVLRSPFHRLPHFCSTR
jgi:hypothetical protein